MRDPIMAGRTSLRKQLEQDNGDYPPSIILKPDEILAGRLVRYSNATTKYGDCVIAIIENEIDGEAVSLWLTHTVLRNEFARQKPKPGEYLACKYFGTDARAGYHRWKVLVDREDALPDFEGAATEDCVPEGDGGLSESPPPSDADAPPDDDVPF